jgi:hypothetical protein
VDLKRDFTFDISTAKENEMQTSKQKTSRRKWSTSVSKKSESCCCLVRSRNGKEYLKAYSDFCMLMYILFFCPGGVV